MHRDVRELSPAAGVESALERLSDSAERRAHGTAPGLRRTIAQLPENSSTHLAERYATLYRSVLNESLLLFFHISKSGGTALCELSKLNGCWRAAAGESTLNTNCVDRGRFDGPWWLPHTSIKAIMDTGLRHFAETNFKMPMRSLPNRRCGWRGSRGADDVPTFRAVEGSAPEGQRCAGMLEMLMLREPLARLASFGREIIRWGLVPEPHRLRVGTLCEAEHLSGRECVQRRYDVCGNFSAMLALAPAVYDNQFVRTLLGQDVYALPAGGITRLHFIAARARLQQVDVLLLTGANVSADLSHRLGWSVRKLDKMYLRTSAGSRLRSAGCELVGAQRARAAEVNVWDRQLWEEAQRLYDLDAQFFARAAVRRALLVRSEEEATAADADADADGAAATPAACGLLQEQPPAPPPPSSGEGSGWLPSMCLARAAGSFSLHSCCWEGAGCAARGGGGGGTGGGVGGGGGGGAGAGGGRGGGDGRGLANEPPRRAAPMPRLPPPTACVLPPAGALDRRQRSVRLPAVSARFTHASCALACGGRTSHFGLEGSGLFCFCMDGAEVARATSLHRAECAQPCTLRRGQMPSIRWRGAFLPCGGVEAVAIFDSAAVLRALGPRAAAGPPPAGCASPAGPGGIAALPLPVVSPDGRNGSAAAAYHARITRQRKGKPCAEGVAPCERSLLQIVPAHTLYTHLVANHSAGGADDAAAPPLADTDAPRALLGCFSDRSLLQMGTPVEPRGGRAAAAAAMAAMASHGGGGGGGGGGSGGSGVSAAARLCSAACATHTYFAVGRRGLRYGGGHAALGACSCLELPLVEWRRDERGMRQLEKEQLQPAKPADAKQNGKLGLPIKQKRAKRNGRRAREQRQRQRQR